jgi:hypothetical protein
MTLTRDELESELRKVDESIARLSVSDSFVEDLVASYAYRKTLLAALADRPPNRAQTLADLDLWRKAVTRAAPRTDIDAEGPFNLI